MNLLLVDTRWYFSPIGRAMGYKRWRQVTSAFVLIFFESCDWRITRCHKKAQVHIGKMSLILSPLVCALYLWASILCVRG